MKWLKAIGGVLLICIFIAGGMLSYMLYGSKPQLSGTQTVNSISQPVEILRDEFGMVQINAANQIDAYYAQGFVHGQDRFFQMDLLRRNAAGELSALFGKGALSRDQRARFHQFRQRAQRAYQALPSDQQAILTAYTQGVNDALNDYDAKAFEYLLTGADMAPWQVEDSLLVIYSMYMDLQGSQVDRDLTLTHLHSTWGADMVDFLLSPSPYQAAIDGSQIPLNDAPIPPLIISTAALSIDPLSTVPLSNALTNPLPFESRHDELDQWVTQFEEADIGSNNWAVSAHHTDNEHALLANDMHLGLNLPAIWYRVELNYPSQTNDVSILGVSLPGAPGIIVGSNRHVAWGFTNANVDNVDWVALPDDYPTTSVTELIDTPEGPVEYPITMSEYGPVKTINGQKYALVWVAHTDYAVGFDLLNLADAQNIDEMIKVAKEIRIPVQNMMMADTHGDIAYRLTGAVTRRAPLQHHAISIEQYAGVTDAWEQPERDTPIYSSNPNHTQSTYHTQNTYQKLWSANARVLSTKHTPRYGDGGYALGPRGLQIANRLAAQSQFNEADFLALQLDNRAIFMTKWRDVLLTTLSSADRSEYRQAMQLLQQWQACACKDDVGYSLARYFRTQVMYALMTPLYEDAQAAGVKFSSINRHLDTAVTRILTEEPMSWLPAEFDSYQAFKEAMFMNTVNQLHRYTTDAEVEDIGLTSLAQLDLSAFTWGKVNALNIRHPISRQVPILSRFLDMPTVPGFGDSFVPAVQNGTHGASQRFIIQPGLEENAYMSIPGGQSGHPLSEYYDAGFSVYAEHQGLPLTFQGLAHRLTLKPMNDQ